jgi:hypothetical protein
MKNTTKFLIYFSAVFLALLIIVIDHQSKLVVVKNPVSPANDTLIINNEFFGLPISDKTEPSTSFHTCTGSGMWKYHGKNNPLNDSLCRSDGHIFKLEQWQINAGEKQNKGKNYCYPCDKYIYPHTIAIGTQNINPNTQIGDSEPAKSNLPNNIAIGHNPINVIQVGDSLPLIGKRPNYIYFGKPQPDPVYVPEHSNIQPYKIIDPLRIQTDTIGGTAHCKWVYDTIPVSLLVSDINDDRVYACEGYMVKRICKNYIFEYTKSELVNYLNCSKKPLKNTTRVWIATSFTH